MDWLLAQPCGTPCPGQQAGAASTLAPLHPRETSVAGGGGGPSAGKASSASRPGPLLPPPGLSLAPWLTRVLDAPGTVLGASDIPKGRQAGLPLASVPLSHRQSPSPAQPDTPALC